MTKTLSQSRIATKRGVSLFTRMANARALARQRRQLAGLDDEALRDIGITRDKALAESRRVNWDAPAHWRL